MKLLREYSQNFLQNSHYAEQIVQALELNAEDNLIEVGAGAGILTKYIVSKPCRRIHLVEIDPRWSEFLKKKYGDIPGVEIITQDFLLYKFESHWGENDKQLKVIGNIPYNITSQIIFKLIENNGYISRVVLMVQKEVADRLKADPGSKEYGITTILLATKGHVKKLFDIGKENFRPMPKVDSSVVLVDLDVISDDILDYQLFVNLIRGIFGKRRKKIKNSLSSIIGKDYIGQIKSIDLNARPEELSLEELKLLANETYKLTN